MSLQELLSKDYQKNILPIVARVGVILGNLYVFLFYSGWQHEGQFGPVISHLESGITVKEAMKSFSTIDMTVVILAVLVCVHQLSFRRPDIDSFNEIMTFPASEKNWTILLLVCCIFKFFYQLPTKETGVLGCWNDSWWTWLLKVNKSYSSDWKSVMNNPFSLSSMPDEWMCVVSNLILICSSIACVFSSSTFKYQIRNAEREMANQLLSYALGLNIFMAAISVVVVIFTQDMKYLGSFFLLAFVLDMIRISWNSYMRVKGSSQKLEIGDYIVSLKWISIATLGLVLFSSYYAYLLEEVFGFRRSNSIYKISSYFLLFHRNDNESGYIIILILACMVVCFSMIDFCSRVREGSRLEMFDIHMLDNIEKILDSIETDTKKKDLISESSYFYSYFLYKIASVLDISEEKMFTTTYAYKPKFIWKLLSESLVSHIALDNYRANSIAKLVSKKKIIAQTFLLIRWMYRNLSKLALRNAPTIVKFLINIYLTLYYLFYLKQSHYYFPTMCCSLLIWNLLSLVTSKDYYMGIATLVLLYPFLLIDYIQITHANLELFNLDQVLIPFSRWTHPILLLSLSTYLALVMTQNEQGNSAWLHNTILKMEVKNKTSSQSYDKIFKLIWDKISEPMYKLERYITLLLAILTALQFISILNFILVILALFLLWDESLDKKYWRFFNCYIIFHIILKHFSNYLLNRRYFNIEIMSLLGLFSIDKDGTDHNNSISVLMVMDLLVIYFSSKWYLKIRIEENTKWTKRNTLFSHIDELTVTSLNFTGIKALKNTYIYFKMMLKYYSIWIYHILANLILLSDYRDILTVFLFTWESGTALLHIFIWKNGGSHPYRQIYKSWILSYYFIIAYCLLRYTSFFVQYDYTRQLLTRLANTFGLDGDQMVYKIRKDIGEKESENYGSYVGSYIMPLLLLTTASITRLLLLSYFEQQEAENTKNQPGMTFGDSELEGYKDLPSRLTNLDAGISSPSGALTPRRISSIQTNFLKKSSLDFEKTEGQELYQRELLGIKRRASHFIVMYMFFKALFTILISMLLQTRVTIFKFFMITCYLLNLRSIFAELHKLCNKFKVMELFSLRVRYFYLTFLTSKKWKHQSDADINFIQSYMEKSEKIDIAQNKAYYEIFLHELEQILLRVNKVYWGLNYFPLVGLVALLSILNFVLPDSDFIQLYRFDRIFGIDQTVWNNWPLFSRELIYIQGVIVSLYLEYMLTSFYLDCRNDLTDMDDQACQTLLHVIETKYNVMICLREGKIKDKMQAKAYLAQYKEALLWNPKDSDRGQKGCLNRRAGTFLDKKIINLSSSELIDKCDVFQVNPEDMKNDENPKSRSVDQEDASQSKSVTPECSNNSSVGTESVSSESEKIVDKSITSYNPDEEEGDYRTNGSNSALNMVNKNISAPPDRNEIAGLAMLKNKALNDGTKDSRILFLSELTTKEEMLLLLFRNRYKFYFCKTLGALLYSLPRLTMIPLIYPLVHTVNFTSLIFFITIMVSNTKVCKTFMQDANQNSNLVIGYLISMMLHSFLHEALYLGEPGKDLSNANLYTKLIDNPYLYSMRSFLIPLDREIYFVSFYWTFVYSLGVCLLPYFLWMTTILLFKQTIRKKNTFWYYLLNKNRKRTVAIDYIKWRKSKWRFINVYYKTFYTNTVEAYAIIVMSTFMIYWHNVYMPLLFFTMVVILSERYRSERVDTESTRIYYLRNHKRITRLYITGYWFIMYFLHFIEFMGKLGFFSGYKNNRGKFMREFEGTFLILCLLVGACIVRDLLYSEDFIKINHKIKTDREMKLKYSGLVKSYEHNERKIYKRLVDISRKDILNEVSEACLDPKKQLSLINFIKDQEIRDVVTLIDGSFNSILSKYVSTLDSFQIMAIDYMYQFLISRTEPYNGEDMMILFEAFTVRNGAHIQTKEINLEDYFDDNLSFFSKSYDKVTRFYHLLGSDNELDVKVYHEAVNKQLSITYETPEPRYQGSHNELARLAGCSRLCSFAEENRNINFKLSADILFSALTSTDQYGACSSLETYKVAFKKNGFMDCFYGMTRITLYNLKGNNYLDTTDGYTKFSLGVVITIIRKVFVDRFDKIAAFTLIILYVIYGGFMNVIILGVLIFNVYIEETTGRSTAWLILYSLMTILMIAKRFYALFSNQLAAHFFLGDLDSNYDIYSLIIVVTTIQALKQYSPDSKASVDYENPAIAIARLAINQDFRAMIGRIALSAIKRKEALNEKLITIGVSNVDSISEEDFKLIMIKQLISNKVILKRFKTEGVQLANRLLRSLRFDYLKLSRKKIESFFFRNFSYHLRKPGKDYFSFVSILYILMIFFILLFFPTLGSVKAQIASFLFDNTVTAFTVLNFTIYLTFFLMHFSFDQVNATDNGGLKAKHYTIKLLEGIKTETPNKFDLKPLARLKRAVNLVKNATTLRRVRNTDFNIFKDSPHFYLFIATLLLWIYMNISVFFWHSYHGNAKSPVKIGIYKFICEPKDNVRESGETNLQDCSNFNQRLPSQLFYFLNTIYFIVCMYQIRDGKVIIKSKIDDYGSQFKRIIFRLYTFAPLVRETEYTFEYCATHTSLNFTDYLLVKEIEHSMKTAKVIQLSRMKTKTGKTLDPRQQSSMCFAIITLLIGIICFPLYLFYDDAGVSFYPINSASFKIDVYSGKTIKMMNLVSLEKLSENRMFDYEKDRQTINLLNNTDVLKRYPLMQFRVV